MKRLLLAFLLVFALAVPSFAKTGVYAGLKFIDSIQNTGEVSRPDELRGFGIGSYSQNTVGGGLFVGYDFYPNMQFPLRAEIEYAVRTNMSTTWEGTASDVGYTGDIQWNLQTLFANVYFDFHNDTALTPYIGGGIGMGFITTMADQRVSVVGVSISGSDRQTDTVFAWNAGIGCAYAFNDLISLDVAYRYVGLGGVEYDVINGRSVDMAPSAHEISAALRFSF